MSTLAQQIEDAKRRSSRSLIITTVSFIVMTIFLTPFLAEIDLGSLWLSRVCAGVGGLGFLIGILALSETNSQHFRVRQLLRKQDILRRHKA